MEMDQTIFIENNIFSTNQSSDWFFFISTPFKQNQFYLSDLLY